MITKINLNDLSLEDVLMLRTAVNFEIKYYSRIINELKSNDKAITHFNKKKLKLARLRAKLNVELDKYMDSLPF